MTNIKIDTARIGTAVEGKFFEPHKLSTIEVDGATVGLSAAVRVAVLRTIDFPVANGVFLLVASL